jgi:hydroxyethylthiazole kinase-like uncharacterized protein yjeF
MKLTNLSVSLFDDQTLKLTLPPPRPANAHKKSFGSLQIFAGSAAYPGAALLCSLGAFKAGCGHITIETESPLEILVNLPELIPGFNEKADAFVVGPGFSPNLNSKDLSQILAKIPNDKPLLLDGGALRLINSHEIHARTALVLTPHEGELASLLGPEWTATQIQQNRLKAVEFFATKYQQTTLLLKGSESLVYSKGKVLQLIHGNVAMATAGQGDLLSGVIGAYLALGLDTSRATAVAASLCALAAEELSNHVAKQGVLAHEIGKQLPFTLEKIRGG